MRHSEKRNFLIRLIVLTAAFLAVCFLLDFVLYPCTYIRNDVHSVVSAHHDVIFLGTSDGKQGIDPDVVLAGTGKTGHNLCNGNQYPVDSYYLLKLLLEKQRPEEVIYEVDMGYLTAQKEPGNNYLLFYHEFPLSRAKFAYFADTVLPSDFRALFFPFYEYPLSTELARMKDTVTIKLSRDYSVEHLAGETAVYHENGYMERYPVKPEDFPAINARSFSEEEVIAENMTYIGKIIDLCKQEGIRLRVVVTPQPDATVQLFPDVYERAWAYVEQYFNERDIRVYNFNTTYYALVSHDTSVYVDYNGHMNADGARAFSAALGSVLYGTEAAD